MPAERLTTLKYTNAGLKDVGTVFGNVTLTHLYIRNPNYLKGEELEGGSIPSRKTKDCMPLPSVPSLFLKHFSARCIMENHVYIHRYIHGLLLCRHCVLSI